MTLNDLIERLEAYREELGGDAEVRLMTQYNWPFENSIASIASGTEINDAADDDDPEPEGGQVEGDTHRRQDQVAPPIAAELVVAASLAAVG